MSLWAQLALALATLAGAIANWARERRLMKAGEDAILVDALRRRADDLAHASRARDEARARADRVPRDRELPDDGFRRD